MGNSIPEESVIEKCLGMLGMLDIALYRHWYCDQGTKIFDGKSHFTSC